MTFALTPLSRADDSSLYRRKMYLIIAKMVRINIEILKFAIQPAHFMENLTSKKNLHITEAVLINVIVKHAVVVVVVDYRGMTVLQTKTFVF